MVVGSEGLLGRELCKVAVRNRIDITKFTHSDQNARRNGIRHLDLLDPLSFSSMDLTEITHAIILAGITSIASCEREPRLSYLVNVVGTSSIAIHLNKLGIKTTIVSSSQVFSRYLELPGVDSPRNPVCEYGRQKVALEDLVGGLDTIQIVRLTKVLSSSNALFRSWITASDRGENITVFVNASIAPIALPVAAEALLRAATNEHKNQILHLSPLDEMTYFDVAHEFMCFRKMDLNLVRPLYVEDDPYSGHISGPYSALGDVTLLHQKVNIPTRDVLELVFGSLEV